MTKVTWTIIFISIIVFGGIIWLSKPNSQNTNLASVSSNTQRVLESEESLFDFGKISMAAGKVSHIFQIRNSSSDPVLITKLYTSCMCTTATLILEGERRGPFGMPGHSIIPQINKTLAPGADANIEVMFDPAAHGPAGVGQVERVVYVETNFASTLELRIKARVTP